LFRVKVEVKVEEREERMGAGEGRKPSSNGTRMRLATRADRPETETTGDDNGEKGEAQGWR
jgi:hypothetical protein